MSRFQTIVLAGFIAAAFAHSAAAVTIWDESVNGDLSGDPAAPTVLAIGLGTNSITGTADADQDFFTITVPDGANFTQLLLTSFESTDDLAFLAIQSGPMITDLTVPDNLLGWLHTSAAFVGSDILDDLALSDSAGAIGFTVPLGPGTYTLVMQQTNPGLVAYGFDLIIEPVAVPQPPMATLLALGLCALAVARRRRA
jgi:hypothetical protein